MVSSRIDSVFSEADREAIRAATTAAERKTAAELVVYVVERCDPHSEVAWKAALIGAAWGAACAAVAVWLAAGWAEPHYLWILIGTQVGLVAGWLAGRLESVARRLVDREALESRVEGRAAEAFLERQVFATKERTGVLIFVALFEHRVVVLPDQGISARVDPNAWDSISSELARGIRAGAAVRALIDAVGRCVDVLTAHGVPGPDAKNQLPDEPRFRRE